PSPPIPTLFPYTTLFRSEHLVTVEQEFSWPVARIGPYTPPGPSSAQPRSPSPALPQQTRANRRFASCHRWRTTRAIPPPTPPEPSAYAAWGWTAACTPPRP